MAKYFAKEKPEGVPEDQLVSLIEFDIFEKPWNTFIVLDSCRLYEFYYHALKLMKKKCRLESRFSTGGDTEEFLSTQMCGKDFSDTTILTANPMLNNGWLTKKGYEPIKAKNIEPVWDYGWDEELGTVPPKSMMDAFYKFKDEDKLIMWFMQPHWPFIEGDKLLMKKDIDMWKENPKYYQGNSEKSCWWALRNGLTDIYTVSYYYKLSLINIMSYVNEIVKNRKGTIIITSDHGNTYECPFGHNKELDLLEVRAVPWLTVSGE